MLRSPCPLSPTIFYRGAKEPFGDERQSVRLSSFVVRHREEVTIVLARPGLPSFEYVAASTPAEAHRLLQQDNAQLMMGGTDLFPQMREGACRPTSVVDVKHLPGMRNVAYDNGAGLTVGAAVTMNQLAKHPAVQTHYRALAQAAGSVGSYQLRNRATVGGNLCNASPCADTSPAVLALEGVMVLHGPEGIREVAAGAFFVGPGRTALRPAEFLAAIRFPVQPADAAGCYLKLGRSRLGDLALVGVAVVGSVERDSISPYRFRIVLGSVAPVPLRVPAAEQILAANPPGEETFAAAAETAMRAAAPISDVRASATYQTMMVRTLTLRALRDVWEQLRPSPSDFRPSPLAPRKGV